ncbi:MAG TPA: hypothetical protein ACFCUC_17200 [Desulfobacterales bacterium]
MSIPKKRSRTGRDVNPLFPVIQCIRVDLAAIASISHRCRPQHCDASEFCCAQYEVCVTEIEMQTIVGYMPLASQLARHLCSGNRYRNVFEEIDTDLLAIDTDDQDLCLFAYRSDRGTLCVLHSVAERLGRLPVEIKPQSCTLWPLAMAAARPAILSVQTDAERFACNRIRSTPARNPDAGIEEILRMVFGEDFLRSVRRAMAIVF